MGMVVSEIAQASAKMSHKILLHDIEKSAGNLKHGDMATPPTAQDDVIAQMQRWKEDGEQIMQAVMAEAQKAQAERGSSSAPAKEQLEQKDKEIAKLRALLARSSHSLYDTDQGTLECSALMWGETFFDLVQNFTTPSAMRRKDDDLIRQCDAAAAFEVAFGGITHKEQIKRWYDELEKLSREAGMEPEPERGAAKLAFAKQDCVSAWFTVTRDKMFANSCYTPEYINVFRKSVDRARVAKNSSERAHKSPAAIAIALTRDILAKEEVVPFPCIVCANLMGVALMDTGESHATDAISGTLGWCSTLFLHADERYDFVVEELLQRLQAKDSSMRATAPISSDVFLRLLTEQFQDLMVTYLSRHWSEACVEQLIDANSVDAWEIVEVLEAATGDKKKTLDKYPVLKGSGRARVLKKEKAKKAQQQQEPVRQRRNSAQMRWDKLQLTFWKDKVMKDLSSVREFSTMVQIMKSVENSHSKEVQEAKELLRRNRAPFIVLLGGGMAAGKSTVVKKLSSEWEDAVTIEADDFKMQDVLFQTLTEITGSNGVSRIVHEHSTNAANKQLLAALANQRDIVMDGTMMWKPFVEQLIAMLRQAHCAEFELGPGWDEKTGEETYFAKTRDLSPLDASTRKPYTIKVVGVTCDPVTAVARGLRRFLITTRGVGIRAQLRSHRLFSENFLQYLALVDEAQLYDTTVPNEVKTIASYEATFGGKLLTEDRHFLSFMRKKFICDDAAGAATLYGKDSSRTTPRADVQAAPRALADLFLQKWAVDEE